MTEADLIAILPTSRSVAGRFIEPLSAHFSFMTPMQIAMFLAQAGHESAGLTRLRESLIYSSADRIRKTWPTRFPSIDAAQPYVRNEQALANMVYSGRMGNGPAESGEGFRYRGRGIFQVTGKDNYRRCGEALGLDLLAEPELLEQPQHAVDSAIWFWEANNCAAPAQAGDVRAVTRIINGGYNGLEDREHLFKRAKAVLGL
jgi:putative chitinase